MIVDLILDALKKSQAAGYQTPSSGGMPAAKQSLEDPRRAAVEAVWGASGLKKSEEEEKEEEEVEEEEEEEEEQGDEEDEKPLTISAAKDLFRSMFQEHIASLNKSVTSEAVSGEDTDQTLKGAENA